MINKNYLKILTTLLISLFIIGCATKQKPDPYEPYNRAIFNFNLKANKYAVQPVVDTYDFIVPRDFQNGIGNFLSNTQQFPIIINDLLQADLEYTWKDSARLVLNSIFGVFGLFDVAKTMGLPYHNQGFGMTLAKWGYTNSPYFVLPFLGPSTVRGTIGLVPDYFLNPIIYFNGIPHYVSYTATGLYIINTAATVLPQFNAITEYAIDPYIAVRNAYLQRINAQISQLEGKPISNLHGQNNDNIETEQNNKNKISISNIP